MKEKDIDFRVHEVKILMVLEGHQSGFKKKLIPYMVVVQWPLRDIG